MKYFFHTTQFTKISENTSKCTILESEGETLEEAYGKIESQIPEGFKVWCFTTDESMTDDN